MTTIPISEARRRWRAVVVQATIAPVLVTRHGRPWVIVVVVSCRLATALGGTPSVRERAAGRCLCSVASRARDGEITIVDALHRSARVAVIPAA